MSTEIRLSDSIENLSQHQARTFLRKFYQDKYDDGSYSPSNGIGTWMRVIPQVKFRRGLDIGCGLGIAIRECAREGIKLFGIDIANANWKQNDVNGRCCVASARYIPFKDNLFDFVLCSDVLEHIPIWDIRAILNEIRRVGSHNFLFNISMIDEKVPVNGNIYTHITIKPEYWWEKELELAKYKNIKFHSNEHHITLDCTKN